ncbi:MAG: MarR family transcriptional regulator [Solirubrobacterales bacterium]|nr:MarR family transcriptional regulator [Solirubrobacterales bacterium]
MAIITELGLSFQQSMALMRLEPGVPTPMSALATAMQCDNSNVTGIVDRLEAAGLAERRAAEHDRRVKAVALTEKGERIRLEVERRIGQPPPALAALSDEDAIALRDILRRAAATLDAP